MPTVTDKLAAALRNIPDDAALIEHNPDEGMRLSCCDGKVIERLHGFDSVKHTSECWAVAARAALLDYDNACATREPSGEEAPEPWAVFADATPQPVILDAAENVIFTSRGLRRDALARARRTVACVNACSGIPTATLERVDMRSLVDAAPECGEPPSAVETDAALANRHQPGDSGKEAAEFAAMLEREAASLEEAGEGVLEAGDSYEPDDPVGLGHGLIDQAKTYREAAKLITALASGPTPAQPRNPR
ncbi:MAG: hypothetical protein A2580_11755 [Hydrogenophilales bacterium RIFOXYD1_FULL_62_11]|nr:MAG: hypothetical protein A2580_11755 [Hydrogenophilales bacterium RIFOXYD1_FULL_62_11]